jgi:hypothetical protein
MIHKYSLCLNFFYEIHVKSRFEALNSCDKGFMLETSWLQCRLFNMPSPFFSSNKDKVVQWKDIVFIQNSLRKMHLNYELYTWKSLTYTLQRSSFFWDWRRGDIQVQVISSYILDEFSMQFLLWYCHCIFELVQISFSIYSELVLGRQILR